nr:hypothetical protein [Brevundimonas diminuta]
MTFTRITALAVSSAALLAVAACGQNETKKEPAPCSRSVRPAV